MQLALFAVSAGSLVSTLLFIAASIAKAAHKRQIKHGSVARTPLTIIVHAWWSVFVLHIVAITTALLIMLFNPMLWQSFVAHWLAGVAAAVVLAVNLLFLHRTEDYCRSVGLYDKYPSR